MLISLRGSTASWVQKLLCVDAVSGGEPKRNLTILCLLRPVIIALEASTEGLSLDRVVLSLESVVEFVSKATQILGFDHSVNVVRLKLRLSVSVVFREVLFIVHKAWVNLNLTGLHMSEFPVFLDVGWCPRVARLLVRE